MILLNLCIIILSIPLVMAIKYNNYMKLLKTLAIAVIVLLLLIPASAFSMRSLTAKHSNQGYITDYLFSLSSQYSYPWATARIDFPI